MKRFFTKPILIATAATGLMLLLLCGLMGGDIFRALTGSPISDTPPATSAPASQAGAGASAAPPAKPDSAASMPAPPELAAALSANDELVFSYSIADFVTIFDLAYEKSKGELYFPPSSRWVSYPLDNAPHSNYKADYYHYQHGSNLQGEPILSVYTPVGEATIQTMTLDFDLHAYTPQNSADYEELCFYTLQVFFPDLEPVPLRALVKALNAVARGPSMETAYGKGVQPTVLYYRGAVGVYPHIYGQSSRICVIPVSPQVLQRLANAGVALHEIAAS